jgi:CheY-like chemotaxis protein
MFAVKKKLVALSFLLVITACMEPLVMSHTKKAPQKENKSPLTKSSLQEDLPFTPLEYQPFFPSETKRNPEGSQVIDYSDADNFIPKHLINLDGDAFNKSLSQTDRRMAYSAAISSLEMNPVDEFENFELVMPIVAESIHLTGVRNIYTVSANTDLVNQIKNFCRRNGYVHNSASNAMEALKELHYSSARDLILIDSALTPTDIRGKASDREEYPRISLVRENDRNLPKNALFARELTLTLKKDVRTRHIPIVMLAAKQSGKTEIGIENAREIYRNEVVDVISKPLDFHILAQISKELFHQDNAMSNDSKREAENLVLRACRAISNLKDKATVFDLSRATPSLIEAFQDPLDNQVKRAAHLRVAAIRAMESIVALEAFDPLLNIVDNISNPLEVRSAAIDCLGLVYLYHTDEIGKNKRDKLIRSFSQRLKENKREIWQNAANALGHVDLSLDEMKQLAVEHRLNKFRK